MRTNGLLTGTGTCQATLISVDGSWPKAMWRPKGCTEAPGTVSKRRNNIGALRRGVGRVCAEATLEPITGAASRAPAPASPPLSTVRRERCDCNQSCCSATDIERRSLGVGCRVTLRTVNTEGDAKMNGKRRHDEPTLNF